jgi:hypothetical protein
MRSPRMLGLFAGTSLSNRLVRLKNLQEKCHYEDMTNWSTLKHAYGSAEQLPSLIQSWIDAGTDKHDLFGHLFHQGTVYSASFEAIPLLLDVRRKLPGEEGRLALTLIGAIWSSTDRHEDAKPSPNVNLLLPHIEALTIAAMEEKDLKEDELPYLMLAVAAFRNETFWVTQLNKMDAGEFYGICPECEMDLYVVLGNNNFVTHEEYVLNARAQRNPIAPCVETQLPDFGQWLFGKAMYLHRNDLAACFLQMFGHASCTACSMSIRINEAIGRTTTDYTLDGKFQF